MPPAEKPASKADQVPPAERGFFWHLGSLITANQLTVGRGILALLVIPFWLWGSPTQRWITFIVWVLCWVGDGFDGAIARARNDVTSFGKVYDPLIDKLQFYATAFVLPGLFWPLVWVLCGLDVISTLLRGRATSGANGANKFGKTKTVTGVTALGFAAIQSLLDFQLPLRLPDGLLLVAIICACFSLYSRLGSLR